MGDHASEIVDCHPLLAKVTQKNNFTVKAIDK